MSDQAQPIRRGSNYTPHPGKRKILFYDLETTGVNHWENAIHHLSGCIDIDGEIVETFDFRIAPYKGAVVVPGALAVSKTTEADLATFMTPLEAHAKFIEILDKYVNRFNKSDKMFMAGYNNASFDNNFLRKFFDVVGDKFFGSYFWPNPFDVYVLASFILMEERDKLANFKLETVADYLFIRFDRDSLHKADTDVKLTRDLYYKLVKMIEVKK